jgi:GTP cyclohydrolase I
MNDEAERAMMLVASDKMASVMEMVTGIQAVGDLEETPMRMVMALREMTAGYGMDPAKILSKTFDVEYDEMILVRGVRFTSLCEHHLLPFPGVAHVGYIPGAKVVGLSKLARLVTCFAMRLQIQERMTRQIAEAIQDHLQPKGVGVIVSARHACMGHRGAKQPDAEMVTSTMLGCLREDPAARSEFLKLVGMG